MGDIERGRKEVHLRHHHHGKKRYLERPWACTCLDLVMIRYLVAPWEHLNSATHRQQPKLRILRGARYRDVTYNTSRTPPGSYKRRNPASLGRSGVLIFGHVEGMKDMKAILR